MARWRWVLLIFELVLFAVILILPQVDLPDFTFHGGTAPVVAKAKLAVPMPSMIKILVAPRPTVGDARGQALDDNFRFAPDQHSLLSLFCTLIC
jgi:hypothetical protein